MSNFDKAFVMNATGRRMIYAIDFSINKTVRKIKQFEHDPDKSLEILLTLSELQELKAFAESIIKQNPFKGNDNVDI
jgi:hypothetical protein